MAAFATRDNLWTMKDKKTIRIKDMTTNHIKNCLDILEEGGCISESTLQFYLNDPGPTADMASYYFDQELEHAITAQVSKHIDWFEEELERRKNDQESS